MENVAIVTGIGNRDNDVKKSKHVNVLEVSIISAHKRYFQVNSVNRDHEESVIYASVVSYYISLS